MSYEAWKTRHYPTDASEFSGLAHRDLNVQLRATQHALRKWRGLRKENMFEYGLTFFSPREIGEIGTSIISLRVDASNCALCQLCTDENERIQCSRCPITIINGRTCAPEYRTCSNHEDPEPMIALLKRTARVLERRVAAANAAAAKAALKPAPARVGHYNVEALRWGYSQQPDGTYRIHTVPSGEVWNKATPPGAVVADNVQNVDDAALMAFAPRLLSLLCKASAALATGEDSKELQKTIADALIGFANGRV